MQTFKNSVNGDIWEFDDDVIVNISAGVYSFQTPKKKPVNVPSTLKPYTVPSPTSYQLLVSAQSSQISVLNIKAESDETAAMTFTTAAKVTDTFPMDTRRWTKYLGAYVDYVLAATPLPSPFAFINTNGVAVPFTEADIKAFYAQGVAQIRTAEDKLAALVAKVNAATTVADVQAIIW